MIKQAIVPLAGLGTRLLPLSSVIPKELLPINGKPGIEYILEECVNAGISKIIFIISKRKKSIKKYFYNDLFYKKILKKKKDPRLKLEFKKILKYKKMIKFVYQNEPRGTGDAVLKCERFIKNKHFLMLLPDDLIIKKNCSREMIKIHKKYHCSVIASKKINKREVSRYGVLSYKKAKKKILFLDDVIEKPSIKLAPSSYGVLGRYILSKKIFNKLKFLKPGKNGEIHITDAIKELIVNNEELFLGNIISGKYLDCGTMQGYINSSKSIKKI